jgi:beta-galactosidase
MLDRRTFLQAGGAGLVALAAPAADAPVTRRVFPLNRSWMYSPPDGPARRVTLPHTNVKLPWHGFDDKSYQFLSTYRRTFRLPADAPRGRVFIDFAGVMTAATVSLNGQRLGERRGGYVPFSFELTPHVDWTGLNVLKVEVDSTERADIPPFGGAVDYLTFGGIYREAALRIIPAAFIENVFARTVDPRRVEVRCYLNGGGAQTLEAELRDGARVIQSASVPVTAQEQTVTLDALTGIELWDIDRPKLYDVVVRLKGQNVADEYTTRIGIREARFTEQGFVLNGKPLKLRGLNRHQTFPYAGAAMPARVQRRDAWILRKELKCNIVRTSHYPQSPHFLDACDEYGLLVFEEIPGWQHIGDKAWQDLAVRDVEAMIRRDWNHPSVVLWGVRINESRDNHDFYVRTNEAAHRLDPSRQTGGVRNIYGSERLEDVFTMNDFPFPLRPPNHPLYLVTEFNGHMFPVKPWDDTDRMGEHVLRHARVHNQLASDARYAGGIAWCAFDYATHASFGASDRICYHGVSDIFRIPKPAAAFYRSQCDPQEEVVLEPSFVWAWGDRPGGGGPGAAAPICSNCDHLKLHIGDKLAAEADPDRKTYPHLAHPPFLVNLGRVGFGNWGDLKIEGYVDGKLAATRVLSARGADALFHVEPDDTELVADGGDATRVVVRVTDEHGSRRPYSTAAILFTIEGPGEIVGENPFALAGGVGAIWVKAGERTGVIRLTARHPFLGAKTVEIRVKSAPEEL